MSEIPKPESATKPAKKKPTSTNNFQEEPIKRLMKTNLTLRRVSQDAVEWIKKEVKTFVKEVCSSASVGEKRVILKMDRLEPAIELVNKPFSLKLPKATKPAKSWGLSIAGTRREILQNSVYKKCGEACVIAMNKAIASFVQNVSSLAEQINKVAGKKTLTIEALDLTMDIAKAI